MTKRKKPIDWSKAKLTRGPLKGFRIMAPECEDTVEVLCTECDWRSWQVFFIKDYTDKDIGRKCPKCGAAPKLGEMIYYDKAPTMEDIKHVLSDPDTVEKLSKEEEQT